MKLACIDRVEVARMYVCIDRVKCNTACVILRQFFTRFPIDIFRTRVLRGLFLGELGRGEVLTVITLYIIIRKKIILSTRGRPSLKT